MALVIGNGAYLHEPVLANPANDARDMGAALRELGFRVTEAIDVDKATLDARLESYLGSAEGADIALLFYAGHGMQLDGRNLLIPIDAKLERSAAASRAGAGRALSAARRRELEPDEILEKDVEAGLKACAEGVGDHPDDARFAARLHVAKEQRAFKIAMTSSSSDAAEAYLVLYPSGRFATRVRERLAALETRAPPSTPQPVRPSPTPSSAPLETQSSATKTRALISRYFAISNKPTEDGTGLGPLYASSVDFYGKETPRNEIVRQKVAYFRDWRIRSYEVQAHDVSCIAEVCSSTGTVGWALTSESRRVVATGKSTFSFTVDWSDGSGKITSESGAVVSREAHKM